jgi:hypothetical protein
MPRPLWDFVYIKENKPEESLVILPPGQRRPAQLFEGVVLFAGPGAWEHGTFIPNVLKPGDIVRCMDEPGPERPFGGLGMLRRVRMRDVELVFEEPTEEETAMLARLEAEK